METTPLQRMLHGLYKHLDLVTAAILIIGLAMIEQVSGSRSATSLSIASAAVLTTVVMAANAIANLFPAVPTSGELSWYQIQRRQAAVNRILFFSASGLFIFAAASIASSLIR